MDKNQKKTLQENRAKIREAMKDFKHWTVVKIAKITGITRTTVYRHLNEMRAVGTVERDGSRFRLVNPIERMNEQLSTRLMDMRAHSEWTINVRRDEEGDFDFTVFEHDPESATIEFTRRKSIF